MGRLKQDFISASINVPICGISVAIGRQLRLVENVASEMIESHCLIASPQFHIRYPFPSLLHENHRFTSVLFVHYASQILTYRVLQQSTTGMHRAQLFIFTFLCYTSIHSLRTSYSYSKTSIAKQVDIDPKYMGIVDALMLTFLGIGHFIHALKPIKKPVLSLWIAVIICGINYGLIPAFTAVQAFSNIYIIAIIMCLNGFLQSYTWPNLLMIVNSKFTSDKDNVLLGFWSANANVGNIIGYAVFQMLDSLGYKEWQYGLIICALYASANGVYIGLRFDQLEIAGAKTVRQQSFMQYDLKLKSLKKGDKMISSVQDNLIESESKSKSSKSVFSQTLIARPKSMSGLSRKSIRTLHEISSRISRGAIRSVRVVEQPQKVAQTPLSVVQVFKDPNVLLLTITFSLSKSVIYGLMLWLPLYFQSRPDLKSYSAQIPITYDVAAIFGSVGIGYLFKKIANKGLLMIPFMIVLFVCFFLLKFGFDQVYPYFIVLSITGFGLGGIFNTLSGLVVMELTKLIPENLKTSSLGFYAALTMAVGNFTTAVTQILIGFVIGKQSIICDNIDQESIFVVFMIYAGVCLVCLVVIAFITRKQSGQISRGQVIVIEEVKSGDEDSVGEQIEYAKVEIQNEKASNSHIKQ